jgi:hypothetical protein
LIILRRCSERFVRRVVSTKMPPSCFVFYLHEIQQQRDIHNQKTFARSHIICGYTQSRARFQHHHTISPDNYPNFPPSQHQQPLLNPPLVSSKPQAHLQTIPGLPADPAFRNYPKRQSAGACPANKCSAASRPFMTEKSRNGQTGSFLG